MNNDLPLWPPVRRRLPRLSLLAAAGALLAAALVHRAGPHYRAHFSYVVALQEREVADNSSSGKEDRPEGLSQGSGKIFQADAEGDRRDSGRDQ